MMAGVLERFEPGGGAVDVCVVGCGPSGLALAAELAGNGIEVALVGKLLVFILHPQSSGVIVTTTPMVALCHMWNGISVDVGLAI